MPAAAVIPAPIAYIKVVAVKKLVVGSALSRPGESSGLHWVRRATSSVFPWFPSPGALGDRHVYFEKIRVLKAGATPE